jgi:hypothetical protein
MNYVKALGILFAVSSVLPALSFAANLEEKIPEPPEAVWVNRVNEEGETKKVLIYIDRENKRVSELVDEFGILSNREANRLQFRDFKDSGAKVQVSVDGVQVEVPIRNPKRDKVIDGRIDIQKRSKSDAVVNPESPENEILTNRMLETIHGRINKTKE